MTNDTKTDNYTKITSTYPIDNDIVEINGVKYQRVEEQKPQTLFEVLNSFGIIGAEGICNIVAKWLPLEGCHELKNYDYSGGWNDCIKHLKKNLK